MPISALRPGTGRHRRRRSAVDRPAAHAPAGLPALRADCRATRRARCARCFPIRRSCATCFTRISRSCCSARSSSAARADCSSPIPSTRSSAARRTTTMTTVHTGRIVPIYEKAGSVTPRMQRTLVHRLLAELPRSSPIRCRRRFARRGACPIAAQAIADDALSRRRARDVDALNALSHAGAAAADLRGVLSVSGGSDPAEAAPRRRSQAAAPCVVDDRIRESARRVLPFKLTDGQKTALREIVDGHAAPEPMNRLLQGDVGAGKTIVALLAARRRDGERLAGRVHGADGDPGRPALPDDPPAARRVALSRRARSPAASTAAQRREVLAELASGAMHLVVGTHALAEQAVAFQELGLVVIDEQHRFGVLQRATLRAQGRASRRAGHDGDADSAHARADGVRRSRRLGDPRPAAGPAADHARWRSRSRAATRSIGSRASELEQGRQVYVIYPLVEESEKVDLRAATAMADHLQAGGVSGVSRGAAARPAEVGREGPRDGARSRAATCTCSSRRRSSRSASTCRMRR